MKVTKNWNMGISICRYPETFDPTGVNGKSQIVIQEVDKIRNFNVQWVCFLMTFQLHWR